MFNKDEGSHTAVFPPPSTPQNEGDVPKDVYSSIQEINEKVKKSSSWVQSFREQIGRVVIGQSRLVDSLLVGLLTGGHVLLEGLPGLAKTLAVKSLAMTIQSDFKRIQFTPDMLPADIIGTEIYNPQDTSFVVKKGPVFSSILLADEINRAPAKAMFFAL